MISTFFQPGEHGLAGSAGPPGRAGRDGPKGPSGGPGKITYTPGPAGLSLFKLLYRFDKNVILINACQKRSKGFQIY
jgi:hypothetical protein